MDYSELMVLKLWGSSLRLYPLHFLFLSLGGIPHIAEASSIRLRPTPQDIFLQKIRLACRAKSSYEGREF